MQDQFYVVVTSNGQFFDRFENHKPRWSNVIIEPFKTERLAQSIANLSGGQLRKAILVDKGQFILL